ncbi:DtxR family Mn-dependent transcriptional regulator [Elusimicrobium simillimum]|uniref:metal-dependent transcriptional regulator n=1 Tax=Elusimicrobium simillimum TaxID=3143438 RepID=UPI003C6FA886
MENKLSTSMEDYLEAISIAAKQYGVARVKDIRDLMNVKTPSVTGALTVLAAQGYVVHEKYGYVELTPKGLKAAEDIKQRHALLSAFLTDILGVSKTTADIDACKMEHTISKETFEKLTKFVKGQVTKKKK